MNVLDKWKELAFKAPVTPVSEASEEERFSFENFFRQKLGDRHGYKDGTDLLPIVSSFLTADSEIRRAILEDLEQRIETEKENILSEADPAGKARIGSLLKIDQAQKTFIELISDFSLSKEDQIYLTLTLLFLIYFLAKTYFSVIILISGEVNLDK